MLVTATIEVEIETDEEELAEYDSLSSFVQDSTRVMGELINSNHYTILTVVQEEA